MGVLQARGDLDFPEETVGPDGERDLGIEQLDGDRPMVLEVLRQKDRRHPATAQLALDVISPSQRVPEGFEEVRQGIASAKSGFRGNNTGLSALLSSGLLEL